MKLSNLFLIAALVGVLGVIGCDSESGGAAGSGGTAGTGGTAGSGGATGGTGGATGGTGGSGECDKTAAEVCAECDAPAAAPDCESFYDTCLLDPPSANFCEKCATLALSECGI